MPADFIMMRKCPLCGSDFIVPDADVWVYRRGNKMLCSWHCVREYDRKTKTKKHKRADR